jgi:dipeptide/tripeptide permease
MAILVAVVSLCERYAYYGFLGILREHHDSFKNATGH